MTLYFFGYYYIIIPPQYYECKCMDNVIRKYAKIPPENATGSAVEIYF